MKKQIQEVCWDCENPTIENSIFCLEHTVEHMSAQVTELIKKYQRMLPNNIIKNVINQTMEKES